MNYRCRTTAPEVSEWHTVEAETPEDAAQEFHMQKFSCVKSLSYMHEECDGTSSRIHFAKVEVEKEDGTIENFVSRIFGHGIWRRGGVKREELTLAKIAQILGYKHDPGTLVNSEDWVGGESYDDALNRKYAEASRPFPLITEEIVRRG